MVNFFMPHKPCKDTLLPLSFRIAKPENLENFSYIQVRPIIMSHHSNSTWLLWFLRPVMYAVTYNLYHVTRISIYFIVQLHPTLADSMFLLFKLGWVIANYEKGLKKKDVYWLSSCWMFWLCFHEAPVQSTVDQLNFDARTFRGLATIANFRYILWY